MPFGKLQISAALPLHLSGKSEGCLYPRNTKCTTIQITADKGGSFVTVPGKLFNIKVVLAHIFMPNVDDVSLFDRLFIHFLISIHLILGSYFNCWMDTILDRSSTKPGLLGTTLLSQNMKSQMHGDSSTLRTNSIPPPLVITTPTLE